MRFASDKSGPVHPKVMQALAAANDGYAMPYGNDELTQSAVEKTREVFEAPDAAIYFVATGTAANALILATMCAPYQTIFCTPESHIAVDECNAPEFFTGGAKLTHVTSNKGRMQTKALTQTIAPLGSVHGPQPGAISITQVSECGTLYGLEDIQAISQIAKAHDMPLHLDGARFANACAALGCTPAEMSWKVGVDAVSFGGTKNGLMGVEAAVIFDPKLAWEFELRRKRGAQLFSKNRFLGAQMDAYLTDDLWLKMATTANAATAKLANEIGEIEGVSFDFPIEANMIFPRFPRAMHRRLQEKGASYYCHGSLDGPDDEPLSARLVCDWSTPDKHITDFVALLRG